ncbi:hypothetical protein HN51_035254 [Arachis hypogaea]
MTVKQWNERSQMSFLHHDAENLLEQSLVSNLVSASIPKASSPRALPTSPTSVASLVAAFIVSERGIEADPAKVKAIVSLCRHPAKG